MTWIISFTAHCPPRLFSQIYQGSQQLAACAAPTHLFAASLSWTPTITLPDPKTGELKLSFSLHLYSADPSDSISPDDRQARTLQPSSVA